MVANKEGAPKKRNKSATTTTVKTDATCKANLNPGIRSGFLLSLARYKSHEPT
jgi:hypothetical protein